MNMQELAARYRRAWKDAYEGSAGPEAPWGSSVAQALEGVYLFLSDNETPEQAYAELEIAYLFQKNLALSFADYPEVSSSYLRCATIYRRAMAMVKKCEVAA